MTACIFGRLLRHINIGPTNNLQLILVLLIVDCQ